MFRATGFLFAAAAVLLFLYGAMQFADASGGGGTRIGLGDGTFARIESPARQAGTRALTLSALLLGASVVVIVMDRGRRRARARNRAARA